MDDILNRDEPAHSSDAPSPTAASLDQPRLSPGLPLSNGVMNSWALLGVRAVLAERRGAIAHESGAADASAAIEVRLCRSGRRC